MLENPESTHPFFMIGLSSRHGTRHNSRKALIGKDEVHSKQEKTTRQSSQADVLLRRRQKPLQSSAHYRHPVDLSCTMMRVGHCFAHNRRKLPLATSTWDNISRAS